MTSNNNKIKMGPEPTILSRKEVDALYETLEAVKKALHSLGVDCIVTGGSLLGAVRQHSILFCDDDIDMAIIDYSGNVYETIVKPKLQGALGSKFTYQVKPWEGGDRIRPQRYNNVFLDLFVLRRYESPEAMIQVIGKKKNGQDQSYAYVQSILEKMEKSAFHQGEISPLFPCWQFATRKAIEMWTKEVYRESELFPLMNNFKMGPCTQIQGPQQPLRLLKRAFGLDCFDVYYQSISHKNPETNQSTVYNFATTGVLPPLISAGGTWEGGRKVPLSEDQYLPMQPISRARRRFTVHCKETLLSYIEAQTARECITTRSKSRNKKTIYMDGVFDLFHMGHLEAIRQCAQLGDRVIIGVTGDQDAAGYKRPPIVPQDERVAIISSLRDVDKVICPCPLIVTSEFMYSESIDLVVHGFANQADAERQRDFFEIPIAQGKFQRIEYYDGLSTSERLEMIQNLSSQEKEATARKDKKSNWFGYTLAQATKHASSLPYDPIPLELRQIMEPHLQKARSRRTQALKKIRQQTPKEYDSLMASFQQHLASEVVFQEPEEVDKLRRMMKQSLGLGDDFDLSKLHSNQKDEALLHLTNHFTDFQNIYDEFCRTVCIPRLASKYPHCKKWYYQSFPCLRIILPGEFSIGPHADVAYGHSPFNVNMYIPLTKIGGTSSLWKESREGSEDWNPIVCKEEDGLVTQFAGGVCLHWTTENTTEYTRVSLDFRFLQGNFHASIPGGAQQYREGYYNCCILSTMDNTWQRQGDLFQPDARVGFPWTVKDWSKFLNKNRN
jgi:cytidyltransferase-like protein